MPLKSNKLSRKSSKKSTLPGSAEESNSAVYAEKAMTSNPIDESSSESESESGLKQSIRKQLTKKNTLEPLVQTLLNSILSNPQVLESLVDAIFVSIFDKIKEDLVPQIKQDVHDSVCIDIAHNKATVADLNSEIQHLKRDKATIKQQLDDSEQYSRRNCLLLHGVPEQGGEDTTITSLNHINTNLQLSLTVDQIERTHRLGRPRPISSDDETTDRKKRNQKPRPIILKFVSYTQRAAVYRNKKKFKNSGMMITESLTASRMEIMRTAISMTKSGDIMSVWSQDGRITIINNNEKKVNITKLSDLDSV